MLFLLVMAALCASFPLVVSAQVTDLRVTKSGNDVVLSFSVTSGPWHVVRSTSPLFDYGDIVLADLTSTIPLTDTNGAIQPELWFYDASDTGAGEVAADSGQPSAAPLILTSLSPNAGWEGQSITINGSGFGIQPCGLLAAEGRSPNQCFFDKINGVL